MTEQSLNEFHEIDMVLSMKAILRLRSALTHPLIVAILCGLPLALCGCNTEGTNAATATCTLNPSATFSVEQDPPSEAVSVTTTNIVNGSTNTTTTVSESPSITSLSIAATSAGAATWNVQVNDNAGSQYPGTASGPALLEPGGEDNTYPAGATVATFALQCSRLSREISAGALVNIPMDVVQTHTTNGTNVVVGRQGQHSLTPQNTEYRLSATLGNGKEAITLTGSAPIGPAIIEW